MQTTPDVRMAWFDIPAVNNSLNPPTIRLATAGELATNPKPDTDRFYGLPKQELSRAPALLVSYYYLEPFLKNRAAYHYRDWVMDSGAFSAHNSGVKIDLNQYIDKCLELMASDKKLTEIFALDVIGDHEASLKNTEEMWSQGVPAIPCYHANEPEEVLYHIAKQYPKIALGGVALERADRKFKWAEQCFARVWPKKIHGFAFCSSSAIYGLPFHSVDATSWEIGPCAFGNWEKFGSMSVRGSNQDLRSQLRHYLEVEDKARVRWCKEMALLETLSPSPMILGTPSVRLALNGPRMEHAKENHVLAANEENVVAVNGVTGAVAVAEEPPRPNQRAKAAAASKVEPEKYIGESINPEWAKWYKKNR